MTVVVAPVQNCQSQLSPGVSRHRPVLAALPQSTPQPAGTHRGAGQTCEEGEDGSSGHPQVRQHDVVVSEEVAVGRPALTLHLAHLLTPAETAEAEVCPGVRPGVQHLTALPVRHQNRAGVIAGPATCPALLERPSRQAVLGDPAGSGLVPDCHLSGLGDCEDPPGVGPAHRGHPRTDWEAGGEGPHPV